MVTNADGEITNADFGLSCIVGFVVWFWILVKIKKAGMTDEEKRDYERKESSGE